VDTKLLYDLTSSSAINNVHQTTSLTPEETAAFLNMVVQQQQQQMTNANNSASTLITLVDGAKQLINFTNGIGGTGR